jgi:hippurate hydrolase
MVLDDSVMARGAAIHAAIAERFLADGFLNDDAKQQLD